MLAPLDEGTSLCRLLGANSDSRCPGPMAKCWRLSTKEQAFAGCRAPTQAPAARDPWQNVGASRRRNKPLPAAGRQPRHPPPGTHGKMLAPLDERTSLCRLQGTNPDSCYPGRIAKCWRLSTKEQAFAGCRAPTRTASVRAPWQK